MPHGERRAESCSVIQAVVGDGELGLMPVFLSVLTCVRLQRRYRKKCTVVESFSSLLSRGSLEQLSEGKRGGMLLSPSFRGRDAPCPTAQHCSVENEGRILFSSPCRSPPDSPQPWTCLARAQMCIRDTWSFVFHLPFFFLSVEPHTCSSVIWTHLSVC